VTNGTNGKAAFGGSHACGKVILLGEHAVVYGIPAIAVGVERGATAKAQPAASGRTLRIQQGLHHPTPTIEIDAESDTDIGRAFRAIVDCVPGNWLVDASAEIPPGGGLGCSAALGVAISRALVPGIGVERACELAMGWERIFHGNPSGIDAAVSARGGCVLFERGKSITPVRVGGELTLCIGNTGISSGTKLMVEGVAKLREQKPAMVEKSFEGIRALVSNARGAVEAGDAQALGRLMDLNQMLLSGLFVSTPEIEAVCGLARSAGAYGAKLTGAGGGGCVVALAPEEKTAGILRAWHDAGFTGFVTRVHTNAEHLVEAQP
jgi:mevalonate kinase